MDSCARGAFLSGMGFRVSLNWLQAARVSKSAVAMKRIRVERRVICVAFSTTIQAKLPSAIAIPPIEVEKRRAAPRDRIKLVALVEWA